MYVCACVLSHVRLFAVAWTHQAPLSMEFSKQEYWSWLPYPTPGDLPNPGIEPVSPALACRYFTTELPGKPFFHRLLQNIEYSSLCYPVEKAMATHSSTFAWKIPWMEEPGRLQSMGSLRVWQDWETLLSLFTFMHWRRKWQRTPVFLPGESQGQRSLVGCCLWCRTESDMTEVT